MERRLGAPAEHILITQGNLAHTYHQLERLEESLSLRRDVYSGNLQLHGEENEYTVRAALNYAVSLKDLQRFEEAKPMLLKMMPVARCVLGDSTDLTLKMRWIYAQSLFRDDAATLDDLREAVTILEEIGRIARRVLGGAHPTTRGIELHLQDARATLRAREGTPSGGA